jgi:hypothetical protein
VFLNGIGLQTGLDDAIDDPDSDGLATSFELYMGTNPQDADTDNDGVLDADDAVPSFAPHDAAPGGAPAAFRAFWRHVTEPVFGHRVESLGCQRFGGVLFVVAADREVAAAATDSHARMVPVLSHEAGELLPEGARIRLAMFGVDHSEGVAFFDWWWGAANGVVLFERSDGEWNLVFEELSLS